MAFRTDKIIIGQTDSALQLDVSGNVLISGLAGTGTRMVTVSADGSLGTETISGDASADIYGMFGDGAQGNVILNASTRLDCDMNYNNLTIHSNVWLHTSGYVIRVFGTLCISTNAHIACDGSAGTNATSTAGGIGGSAPYRYDSSNNYPFAGCGSAGGAGGRYSSTGTTNGSGLAGGASWATTITTTPYILMGGAGGGGGGPHGNGTITTSWTTGTSVPFRGGAGGTGRSGSGAGSYQAPSGGGGGGGGVLIVYAKTINNQGSIHANGGNGGNGYYANAAGQGGGGGGGGGGTVLVYYRATTGSGIGTLQANGGTVGSNGTGGGNGSNGYTKSYQI